MSRQVDTYTSLNLHEGGPWSLVSSNTPALGDTPTLLLTRLMTFDTWTTAAVADELRQTIVPGRVQQVSCKWTRKALPWRCTWPGSAATC